MRRPFPDVGKSRSNPAGRVYRPNDIDRVRWTHRPGRPPMSGDVPCRISPERSCVPCLLSLEVFSKHLTLRYGRARPGVNPEILSFAGFPEGSLPKRTES